MMTLCPYCGHRLSHPIKDGITGCSNCRRVCDSTKLNRLLSYAWLVRKQDISEQDFLIYRHGATQEEADLVIEQIANNCLSHEEFYQYLNCIPCFVEPQIYLDRAS